MLHDDKKTNLGLLIILESSKITTSEQQHLSEFHIIYFQPGPAAPLLAIDQVRFDRRENSVRYNTARDESLLQRRGAVSAL